MLPTFPKFKHLEWSDRQTVESYTRTFPPYSDFNFVSMWSWNTRRKMMISDLNSNLVLLFYDYLTEKPFLTFIGTNDAPATAGILLEYSERTYNEATLRLVPEAVARCIPQSLFTVTEDIDANDYILSVSYLSKFDTLPRSSHSAASTCQRFLKNTRISQRKLLPLKKLAPRTT